VNDDSGCILFLQTGIAVFIIKVTWLRKVCHAAVRDRTKSAKSPEPETEADAQSFGKGMIMPSLKLVEDISGARNDEYPIKDGVVLGREEPSDIILPYRGISRKHARIFREKDKWFIEDLNSANGTTINGRKIYRDCIADGDVIQMAGYKLLFCDPKSRKEEKSDTSLSAVEGGILATIVPGVATALPTVVDKGSSLERRLQVIYNITHRAAGNLGVKSLLKIILKELFKIVAQAEYGFVILRDPQSDKFAVEARRKRHADAEHYSPSKTIVKYASKNKCALLSASAMEDNRFDAAQSIAQTKTTSIICAPLMTDEDIHGVIYIATRLTDNPFSESDLQLVSCLADTAAVFLKNARLYEQAVKSQRLAAVGQAVASMAHCVKNILNCLQGGTYILDKNLCDSKVPAVVKGWDIVKRNMQLLSNIVLDMLSFSKEHKPLYQDCSINTICRQVVDLVIPQAERAVVELDFQPSDEVDEVSLDEAAIKRCLINLLGKALDSCPQTIGRVLLEIGPSDRPACFIIRISDNGNGIAPEEMEKIFDLFFLTKSAKGAGLGLAVTKKIIEEHGGTIKVDSTVGAGSVFTIMLPRKHV